MLTERFADAMRLAWQLHAGQTRKTNQTPYIAHLLSVTALVLEYGGDEDAAIAALLHDAVEDQGGLTTLAAIRARFGDTVADLVHACSDAYETPKPPWRARKERHLALLQCAPLPVLLISLADKYHNAHALALELHAMGESVWEVFKGGRPGTLWNFRAAADAYRRALENQTAAGADAARLEMVRRLLQQYEAAVADLERLAEETTAA